MKNDTQFFQQALEEFRQEKPENSGMKVGDLTVLQLSQILLRAQTLKERILLIAQMLKERK